MKSDLTASQLDLLLHAGVFGLCRIPADAVADVHALREAGLVELNDDKCFALTPNGERRIAAGGGKPAGRTLH